MATTAAPDDVHLARAKALQASFDRTIRNMTSHVESTSITQAFVYANPEIVNTLIEQTKTLLKHYAHDRWESLKNEKSIIELCDMFDRLEATALKHLEAGLVPHRLTRDPQLSIPPLVLQLIAPFLSHYRSVIAGQRRRNELVHAQILKQATEADRLEKDIADRMSDMKLSIEQIESVMAQQT
ncbi:hypothetical protein CROQUDRAFT_658842 [Cronartium quercuum f. sp. fusiforme G11]|uniref:Uncharacterized protein n=1 Tax=Cronartium quercuum f. sp. fusiforme G11 TaxID=708437 RepID=A0A9P6NFU5_9BASI|nr:hypothetical protein CROQUDRAFT_658842 [Cronartium quercuum f. sp. fusiforme G11]